MSHCVQISAFCKKIRFKSIQKILLQIWWITFHLSADCQCFVPWMYKSLLPLILLSCLDWFWIQSRRLWGQSDWQRSWNASFMLISPLSSLPCSSSACLESCTLQMPSLHTAHIPLTAAKHVVLPRSHLLLSFFFMPLYVTRLKSIWYSLHPKPCGVQNRMLCFYFAFSLKRNESFRLGVFYSRILLFE